MALNSQLLNVQILTNDVQVLILCLSYFITIVNANYASYFSAYVVFLAILVSLAGIVIEPLMITGVTQLHYGYIKAWLGLTAFSFIFSLVLCICFILNNAHVLRIGKKPKTFFFPFKQNVSSNFVCLSVYSLSCSTCVAQR